MNTKTIGLVILVVILAVGLGYVGYLYSTTASIASKYMVLQNQYQQLQSKYQALESEYSSLMANYTNLQNQYMSLQSQYQSLESMSNSSMGIMQPEFIPVGEATVTVNATQGATVRLGNIIAVIRPGTYVETPSGQVLDTYQFSIIDYMLENVGSTPMEMGMGGSPPIYAFAYAVNGQVSPGYTFVNQEGKPQAIITVVRMPSTWTTWTWLGFTEEPNGTLIGGHYAFPDNWVYVGSGIFVNYQFVKPVPWVFVYTGMPAMSMTVYTTETMPNSTEVTTMEPELVPISIGTITVNATQGGAVAVGNLLAIIPPGTYVKTPSGQILSTYNFSLVYQAFYNSVYLNESGTIYWPIFSYAFAVNNEISPGYTFVNASGSPTPVITIAFLPPQAFYNPSSMMMPTKVTASWTWLGYVELPDGTLLGGNYAFADPWLVGDDYIVNVVFVKPVPWVFVAPIHGFTNTTNSMASMSQPSGGYS
ncbi:hypothetical protein [Vulcanisaeta sp. JCM 16161]|uniref:hypothetical protein n=1 Tax=Vulcanisaeta sp. JCM 16161 TaxID=1295372 RepID=UPI00406C7171